MKSMKSERELLEEISKKLDMLIGIFAIQGKDTDAQIHILKHRGLDWEEIGSLVGMKPDAVRMRYSRMNKL